MEKTNRIYIAIDLKSFYASVECADRGLDPLNTNLVVADLSRTQKTICLAVSPPLKAYGIPGRARLFEVVQRVGEVNAERRRESGSQSGASYFADELSADKTKAVDYIVATPRMKLYMQVSAKIYDIYLKYIAPEDIHVYSVDEVFIDVTDYLEAYKMTARELAMCMIREVLDTTGITATVGIGTNLYLCKIAMDIVAKHIEPDKDGVRVAELDEMSYRRQLWSHRPLTDFWRVGRGYTKKLERYGMYTMGDIARCSVGQAGEFYNAELLYKLFGVNAELLIDHAWGFEPCTMEDIKQYKPSSNSLGSGQVLQHPYEYDKAGLIVREMTDLLVLDMVEKRLVTDQMVLTIGYDTEIPDAGKCSCEITVDHYGRRVPKSAHGSINLESPTSSTKLITDKVMELFARITDKNLLVRRICVTANHVVDETKVPKRELSGQLDLFTDYAAQVKRIDDESAALEREKNMQLAMIKIKKKYGKNAILKGMNLESGATAMERNRQVGGHKA